MNINKYKKYISWNLISLIGYCCLGIMLYFLILLLISSSGMGMRMDLDKYFYTFTIKHVITPYLSFYKIQLTAVALLMIGYVFEKKHYEKTGGCFIPPFENHQQLYFVLFVTGLALNFLPIYVLTMLLLKTISKML